MWHPGNNSAQLTCDSSRLRKYFIGNSGFSIESLFKRDDYESIGCTFKQTPPHRLVPTIQDNEFLCDRYGMVISM